MAVTTQTTAINHKYMANVIEKSVEIQKLENAAALFAKMFREVLGKKAEVEVYVTGVDLYTMTGIAQCVTDDEGDLIEVKCCEHVMTGKAKYIRPHFKGEGYYIPQISQ